MLHHVPDVPAAVGELRRIVRPSGMVLVSTNSGGTLAEVYNLFDAAVSDFLGRPVRAGPALGFTTETGTAVLEAEFCGVILHRHEVPPAFPSAHPLVAYLSSIREPVISHVGEPLDFDAALDQVAARVERIIRDEGSFRTVSCGGVFACR